MSDETTMARARPFGGLGNNRCADIHGWILCGATRGAKVSRVGRNIP